MLNHDFETNGFQFVSAQKYIDYENSPSIYDLKKIFDTDLEQDGESSRKRAYLKLRWYRELNAMHVCENQTYYQSAELNKVDGGRVRAFKQMSPKVLSLSIIRSIIDKNIKAIIASTQYEKAHALTIGMHFIRYEVDQFSASYSSPDWLHKDDEPLVFIHLVNLSKNAIGGDNLIADSTRQRVTHVIRLETDLDTLVLSRDVYHAVTPLGSRVGIATRDVILFTVEPDYTQKSVM